MIRIAQSEGLDWKKELRKYVTVYRGIVHNTTDKSPAELLDHKDATYVTPKKGKVDLYGLFITPYKSANLTPKSTPAVKAVNRSSKPRTLLARHCHLPAQDLALCERRVAAAGLQRVQAASQFSLQQSLTRYPLQLSPSLRLFRPQAP
ncbi:hypothetical protein QQF64_012041 [Cirrhinus molitorella]|uniref:Uncharacterized protein n=1 Tax=Cirrhinus molitorella TaxID=172907 RepID=A0ABR3LWV7_9TELE